MPTSTAPIRNPFTLLRLGLLPVLWALALARQPVWLAAGLAVAVLSDVLDGRLARRWPRFADGRLDGLADKLLTGSVAVWLVLLRPAIFNEHPWLLLATTVTYAADMLYGWFKFKRVPGLHLYLGQVGGALQALFVLHALLSGGYSPLLLYLALGVFIVATGEELAILITHSQVDEEQVRSIVPYLRACFGEDSKGIVSTLHVETIPLEIDMIHRALANRRLPWALGLAAAVLTLPALATGFQFDDYLLRAALRGADGPAALPEALNTPFVFMDGNAAHSTVKMLSGVFPWWALPTAQVAFWRPVAALTHWVDFALWPNSPALMHLHSLLWLGLLAAAAAGLYRRIGVGAGAATAGLAGVLYAVDQAHGFAASWLSNRNILIAALFGVLALGAHVRWRRDGWRPGALLSALLLLAALLSAEAAVAMLAYWLAYAVFVERGAWRQRAAGLAPAGAITLVWWLVYRAAGYGLWGTSYLDPFREPLAYARAVLARGPLLLLGQWLLLPTEATNFFDVSAMRLIWLAAVLFIGLLAWVMWPVLRRSALARFWGAGMLLALVPACAALPANRLLFFVGLGAIGLLAEFISSGPAAGLSRWAAWGNSGLTGLLLALHLIVAPLLLPVMAFSPSLLGGGAHGLEEAIASLPADPRLAQQTAVVVYAPNFADTGYIRLLRLGLGLPAPARVRGLASGLGPVRVTRRDANSLVVTPGGGYLSGYDSVFRGADHALALGEVVGLGDMSATVLTLTADRRPASVAFRFNVPLEDASLRWFRWSGGLYVPFTPPAVGETVDLARR